jgi:hypothetical protein
MHPNDTEATEAIEHTENERFIRRVVDSEGLHQGRSSAGVGRLKISVFSVPSVASV